MIIKFLNLDYYDQIVEIWTKAGLHYKPEGRDKFEKVKRQISEYPEMFLGTFIENKLIGVCILTDDGGRKGWIHRLAVDPEYQNHGIATAMINYAEQYFRKKGIMLFAALIEDWNKTSQNLFSKCGYIKAEDIFYFSKRDYPEY